MTRQTSAFDTRKKRTSGLLHGLVTIFQNNPGRLLTSRDLLEAHPLKATLNTSKIGWSLTSALERDILPGLARGTARATWIYQPPEPPPVANRLTLTVSFPMPGEPGVLIAVDEVTKNVYRVEPIG